LDPALDVSQYAHTAWKIRDGFPQGIINSIAQTPDGYLWLGTEFGLARFDGNRAVSWQPPQGQNLASSDIRALLTARDGTLWIGTAKGLASWNDGKLTHYPELSGLIILRLLEDREGTIWAGAYGVPSGRLCSVQKGSVQCYGEDGHLGPAVVSLLEDSKGNLWAGVQNGMWRWRPGPPKFFLLPGEFNGILSSTEDADGAILIGWKSRIYEISDGKIEVYPLPGAVRGFHTFGLLRDRDGGLWIGTKERGLLHVHQGRTDVFSSPDGLSGDWAHVIFEDREGNIWVATTDGLDRFREFAVATLSTKEGLSNAVVSSVLAARDGSVWLGTSAGFNKWVNGKLSVFGKENGKINGHSSGSPSLFQDSRGRIWISTLYEFGYVENERFVPINSIPGGNVHGIGEDAEGNLWLANMESGLFRLSQKNEVHKFPWAGLKPRSYASALVADSRQGAVWLGFFDGGVAYFADGQIRRNYTTADGLGKGWVAQLQLDPDGTLWAATEGGLSRLKDGRITTLSSRNGLPCDTVHWSLEDDDHSMWLYMACGLVRIAKPELDSWIAATDNEKTTARTIQATVFDISDGVRTHSTGGYFPQVAKSTDGRLWFLPFDGVSIIDPQHIPFNKIPPPVHIERITADRKTYDLASYGNGHVPLPARIRDLEIDYTALSLAAPEKVRFRYKLEGRDRDWQDAGTRRQAFYTDLPPRNYRFRVGACNNSGVWNEAGAFLDFSVPPAYYQTAWFRLSCVAAFLAVLWALYQLRLRQVTAQVQQRLEGRADERERIARELHDTLLQSFQGVLLLFQAARNRLEARPSEAMSSLDTALDQSSKAITEARDAIQGLRSSTTETNSLAASLSTLGEELAGNQTNQNYPVVDVRVEGDSRELHPILRDDVFRIAGEALRNAFVHAQASRIEVDIRYGAERFRVRIRDDGKGIESQIVTGKGRAGHWGLRGMHERAQLVGGNLGVWSKPDSGTEVELIIPASTAYAKSTTQRRSWLYRRRPAKTDESRMS
jgi:signal transduction histidine kinase/ligand-binding sensor domain-containing protein